MCCKGIFFILAVVFTPGFCLGQVSSGQARPANLNLAAIEVVLRSELQLTTDSKDPICLTINANDPQKEALHSLRSAGLKFHKGSWCTRMPRGTLFDLKTAVDEHGRLEITAAATDMSLSEFDFAVRLHKYKYLIEIHPDGQPTILNREDLEPDDKPSPCNNEQKSGHAVSLSTTPSSH